MKKSDYQEYQKLIGARIKAYRVNAGISQKDLEDISGVSVRSISRLEQGASVQVESLFKILIASDLSPTSIKKPFLLFTISFGP